MDRLLALQASAGSGKTYSLSVRYISLLFLGAKPNSIIALTFTKKAANEMKERIFKTLSQLESKNELHDICLLTKMNQDEILQKKPLVLKTFLNSNLHIQTIDAFFAKILRKFSLHLGIMPDFTPTDVTHESRLEEAFVETLSQDSTNFNTLINFMLHERKSVDTVFLYFVSLYEKSKELNFDLLAQNSYPNDEAILLKAKEIREHLSLSNAPKRTVDTFDAKDLDTLLSKSFWKLELLNNRTYAKYSSSELDRLYSELKDLYKEYCIQKEAYILTQIFELFKLYEKVKFDLITQTNELSFSDITFLTHKLLTQDISNEFLYFRLDSVIEHLLIDEFQDTNVVQFDILEPIISEINAGSGTKDNKTFFYVGDTKQSIYRFRGGSKELFGAVAKRYDIKIDPLDTNYRSKGNLVEFVNRVFEPIFADFTPQKVKNGNENQGFLKIFTTEDLLENLYENIKLLVSNDVGIKDIAVLCHTNKDALVIKDYLANLGLKVSIESTKPLKEVRQVKAIIEFLKFSYFGFRISEKNTLVLLGRSFEENLGKKITNFNRPLEQIVLDAIWLLDLDANDVDVLRFIEISKDYLNIQSFLFELDRLNEPSQNSEDLGIKILTIHKSKGLEFKHVVVLDKLGRKNYQNDTFLFEYEDERLKKLFIRMKNREFVDEVYKNAKQKDTGLNQVDINNALYVAFTRAENSLIILQKEKSSSMDFLKLADFEQGEIISSREQKQTKKVCKFEKIPSFGLQENIEEEDEKEYDLKATYFGLAFHYLLELASDFTDEGLQNAFMPLKNHYEEFTDINEVLMRAKMLIKNDKFQILTANARFKKEQPIIYNGERKQLDLLVEREDEFIIIDYKTSNFIQTEHIKQVKIYKKALKSISDKKISAYLFYVKENEVESLEIE